MDSNLLKEAIADAKAVREVAISNAKLALEEAFAPKLKSMLSAKIQNEVEEPEEEVEAEPFEYTKKEVSDDEGKVTDYEEADEEEFEDDAKPEVEDEAGCEPDEFSLDEIIREFEISDEEDKVPVVDDEVKGANDQEKVEEEKIVEDNYEDEVDLQELINELKEEFENVENIDEKHEKKCDCKCNKKSEKLEKDLNEHIEVIKFLKSKINEINLLNAKLLFTNKLFKDNVLSESQKLNIVETLDRAKSIREIKLVYSTLSESFNILNKNNKKETVNKIRKITEGIASKQIGSTRPNKETIKQVINEGNDLANRFKKLAGI